MQCIFCLQEREPSVEHVYPDAIGGTLIIDRVCKPCNDWLGTNVDVLLTDHVAILAKRNQLGIPNRSGKAPTWHDVFGLGAMANDPNQRVKIVEDAKTGKIKPTFLHKEVRTKPDNGAAGINVTIDASQVAAIGKIIERTRKREGLPPLSEAALHEQIEAAGAEIGTIEHPEVIHKLAFDLWHYQRAICKIIYELAWHWLGDAYLDDPIAHKLRNVILHATEEEIRGQIQLGANTTLPEEVTRQTRRSRVS